jgi:hypothetical protein
MTFSGLASGIFGLREDDPSLFRKVEEPPVGFERYKTTWETFKKTILKNDRYGTHWQHVIEQAVLGAKKGGAALDANLVLIADNEQRHRIVTTTVTTFFNNECEVSLYLIEALKPQRPHFAAQSVAIRIKVDQLAILKEGKIPPEADLTGDGGWETIFRRPVGTDSCKWDDILRNLESPDPWIYPLATLMWEAYDRRLLQYSSVGVRIKFSNDDATEYRVFRLCLQKVDLTANLATFVFAAAALVVPYEPADNPKETRLYHLYNLAWFFRRRLLERESKKLEAELLNKPRKETALEKIMLEISNDFRTLLADAQVRGMDQQAAVIQAFDAPLREAVMKKLYEEWPKMYDELLTNLAEGVPAVERVLATLKKMEPINRFFLKVSIEELNKCLGDK